MHPTVSSPALLAAALAAALALAFSVAIVVTAFLQDHGLFGAIGSVENFASDFLSEVHL